MDDLKYAIIVALIMTVVTDIVIEKSGISVSDKRAHHLKSGLLLLSWEIFYSNNLLGSSYFISGNQDRYRVWSD